MRLPDFLGIGTQKGGTTFVYELLKQHPQVFMAAPKEQHFFTLHWQQGVDWYRNQFALATSDQMCGEVTPYYLFHPEAPRRIHSVMPRTKLIVVLRDPVERALSQYFHSKRLGLEALSLEDALAAEPQRLEDSDEILATGKPHRSHQQHSYVSRGRYEQQISRFKQFFSDQQLLLMRSEQLFAQPDVAWRQILDFLGLSFVQCPQQTPVYAGGGEAANVSSEIKNQLRQQLSSTYQWMEDGFE